MPSRSQEPGSTLKKSRVRSDLRLPFDELRVANGSTELTEVSSNHEDLLLILQSGADIRECISVIVTLEAKTLPTTATPGIRAIDKSYAGR